MKLLKSLSTIYLSLLTLQSIGVVALPAISKTSDEATSTLISSASTKPGNSTSTDITSEGKREKCKPNDPQGCQEGYSCIRFNSDKENNYTCVKDELAYCDSDEYCKTKLGKNYKYCYLPPWVNKGTLKQCFTEHDVGGTCSSDIHCVNTLTCKNKRCVSKEYGSLDEDLTESEENKKSHTIFGINKWIFIAALAFPALIFVLCLWCWFIGRSSSKHLEDEKKAKYENEIKKMTMPNNNNNSNRKSAKTDSLALSEASHQRYLDPQKEIEEEVGKRGFRSLFQKKKGEDSISKNEPSSVDISTTKVGGKAPINTSTSSDTQQKMKNLTTNVKKGAAKKSPVSPTIGTPLANSSRASSVASFPASNASSNQNKQNKTRTNKKKAAGTTAKKTKKPATSSTGNDASNSTSSKQSSQRGLVNNASNMSSALSGQSSSYFSGVSSLDAQSVLYYQQMYNAAAAQAAVQNQYYAQYMQNPYYAAATANAAYYAQDPNAAAMYAANYQNQQAYQ